MPKKQKLSEREKLIADHVPLIKYHAFRLASHLPPNIEINDLIGAGALGLIDAIEKFEPSRGVKFKTYAELRIRGEMLDSLRDLDWAPRSIRAKESKLKRACRELLGQLGQKPIDEEICAKMDINLPELHQLANQLNGLSVCSFYDIFQNCDDEEGDEECLINYYPDATSTSPYFVYEREELKKILAKAIDQLPRKQRLVISLYYYEEFTMKEISAIIRVNESRVSQLRVKACLRLKKHCRALAPV
jgi:RNA polymerase sigma factor for flagellar operon FliA